MKPSYLDLLWDYIGKTPQSPSHDKEHIQRVLEFAKQLQTRYGGDLETIVAAAMLHDIGRANSKLTSKDSAQLAADKAKVILENVGSPENKISMICSAIRQHDQPGLIPDTIEASILKEADFLAGFGAWGILRIAMYQGERGKGINDVLSRLRDKMPERIANLQFPESCTYAQQEYLFIKFFLSLLDKPAKLPKQYSGKYIAFEGISGSGKSTQIDKLGKYLISLGKEINIISEPSSNYRQSISNYRQSVKDADLFHEELHLLLADRYNTSEKVITPALEIGHIVLASRCYLSSLVYQTKTEDDIPYVHFLHRDFPVPDLIILLDIPGEIAMERIWARIKKSGKPLGKNEYLEKLKSDKEKYLRAAKEFKQVIVIDGSLSEGQITEQVIDRVDSLVRDNANTN